MDEDWPTEIRLAGDKRSLAVSFAGGTTAVLPAELLRVDSPSAEVQGHGPTQRRLVAGKRQVRIVAVDAVGNYAVRLTFDDGHATGIFSWVFLRELGARTADAMADYEARLAAAGLDRDTPAIR